MSLIQSNRCALQVSLNGVYTTVMCLRSFRVSPSTEEKEITAPVDGKFKSYDYHTLSARASLDGVLIRDPSTSTVFSFAKAQLAFEELKIRAVYLAENGLPMVFKALCIVSSVNIETSAGQVGAGTVELLVSGEYSIEEALPVDVNLRIRSTGNNTAPAFIKVWLTDQNGDVIFQTDIQPQANGSFLNNPVDVTFQVPAGQYALYYYVDTNTVGNNINLDTSVPYNASFNAGVTELNTYPNNFYNLTANSIVTITLGNGGQPPTCVPVAITGSTTMADATVGAAYSRVQGLSGSQPFVISNVTKPAWLNIQITNFGGLEVVSMTGTPIDPPGTYDVTFDVSNACGTTSFASTVTVLPQPTGSPIINWDLNSSDIYESGQIAFFVNGVYLFASPTSTDNGSFTVNIGDVVEVQMIGRADVDKSLYVDNSTDSVNIYTGNRSLADRSFTWTPLAGKTYQVTGATFNP
jgi:hypothetical protein